MATSHQIRIASCLTRIHSITQSPAVILMTPQGQIIARAGQGTDEEAADLGAAIARVVIRRPFSSTGPVWWLRIERAVLVMCDRRGMDSTLNEEAVQLLEDLKRLLRPTEQILQTTRTPWCMT